MYRANMHQASPPDAGRQDEEGLLLAANCFDNTLRVFHRRFYNDPLRHATADTTGASTTAYAGGVTPSSPPAPTVSVSVPPSGDAGKGGRGAGIGGRTVTGDAREKQPSLQLMHALRGHTVQNWPIRFVETVVEYSEYCEVCW